MTQSIKEQIRVLAAIESECHFFQVSWKMLGTNLVPRSSNSALEERKGRFYGVGVGIPVNVLPFAVHDSFMILDSGLPHGNCVCPEVIGINNLYILADVLADVFSECAGLRIPRMEESEFSIALADAEHHFFIIHASADSFAAIHPANVGGVHFDLPIQHRLVSLGHSMPYAVAEIPRCFIAANPQRALNLASGHALLRLTEQERCGKPLYKGQVGIIEHGASRDGELIVTILAVEELLFGFEFYHRNLAAQTAWAFREAQARKKLTAFLFGREHRVDIN